MKDAEFSIRIYRYISLPVSDDRDGIRTTDRLFQDDGDLGSPL